MSNIKNESAESEKTMRITKIIGLIKKSKKLMFFEGKDCDWLSDGEAGIYPAFNVKDVSIGLICDMYDLDASKFIIRNNVLPTAYNYADNCENEKQITKSVIEIVHRSKHLVAYATSEGIAFIEKRYFAPFTDMDEAYLRVFERYTKDGDLYFAVKNGFELVGILLPAKVITKEFVEDIEAMSKACRLALQNVKEEEV